MHEANDFGRTDAVRIGNGVVEGVIAEVGRDGDVERVVRTCRAEYAGCEMVVPLRVQLTMPS